MTADEHLFYKRNRFSTRLPLTHAYTRSHFWLRPHPDAPARLCTGMTRFATRMLGDLVEFGFEVDTGADVTEGQVIGWVEGMKAAADLYCTTSGVFAGANADTVSDCDLVRQSTYDRGWLYAVDGNLPEDALQAAGYRDFLDETIDRIQGQYPDDEQA